MKNQVQEKFQTYGIEGLSNIELLACIIPHEKAFRLFTEFNSLSAILRSSAEELSKLLTQNETMRVIALKSIFRRQTQETAPQKIGKSGDAYKYFSHLKNESEEHFCVLYLNRNNAVIHNQVVGIGNATSCVVDKQKIFRTALSVKAQAVVLCHNHPSGNDKPSEADMRLTKEIKQGLILLDITTLDHIIISKESYYSFADNGDM